MANKDFAHLHVHTDYSLLDGAAKIDKLVAEAVRQEQPALAITDHGNVFGAFEFWKSATKAGIKPIIGMEAYATPGTSRFDKTRVLWGKEHQSKDDVSARGAYTHLTLLSENNTGMHNLFRLSSLASLEGQYGKWARVDRDLLEKYHEGLIVTAGCPSGEVQTRLRLGQYDEALKAAGEMQEIFGKDNYLIELMDHGIDIERRVKKELLDIAKKIGAPIIATNDSHYVREEDATVQDAMLCINSGEKLTNPDRFKFDGSGYYLRSTREMQEIFADLPEAIDNTLWVAERCAVSFQTTAQGANYMPAFPVPAGEDETSWFIKEVERGLVKRFGENIPNDVRERADYEVGVIVQMGFPGYFLVVADYIAWAREQGIRVGPGRGSGAGSMVAYALGITQLDPIKHDLLFERFLNPERVSMPDLDIDFDDRRRDEVIAYVEQKYGKDNVSQVVTFGTIKTKQALKDSARVLGYPFEMGDRLTKALPPSVMGKDIPIKEIYNTEHPRHGEATDFRDLIESDEGAKECFDLASGLEGLVRQTGIHACAVIMSSKKLTDVIPIMQSPKDEAILTQFEYPQCEELGLIKMDFLGLSNLTVINDTLQNIADNGKAVPDVDNLPFDDKETYELLAKANSLGIFQLESGGMRSLLKQMKMDSFADISAASALNRPGPMGANSHINYALRKNGLQEKTPIHPELADALEDVLGQTHGLIVYQEQVMRIAQKLAGFSLGQADILRKAMGKKKADVLEQQRETFANGMRNNGFSDMAISTLWEILVPFSSYAFNKSHSEAYALVSYQTAYLKAHYPAEFMAALLTSNTKDKTKVASYLAECRRMGISVLVPDVNESKMNYSTAGEVIRVGLGAVRNVGVNVVDGIVSAREEKGAFESFDDFLEKVPLAVCNKRSLESLIKAGAFDSMGYKRRALHSIMEEAVDAIVKSKKKENEGQFDLFKESGTDLADSLAVTLPDIPEWDKKFKLNEEKDMLGLYVSDHPLSGLEPVFKRLAHTPIIGLYEEESFSDGKEIEIAGLITSVTVKTTKAGKNWAVVAIEDLTGSIEVNFFPKTYASGKIATYLVPDSVVRIGARISRQEGFDLRLNAKDIKPLNVNIAPDKPLILAIAEQKCTADLLANLEQLLTSYTGLSAVYLQIERPDGTVAKVELDSRFSVDVNANLLTDLKVLLGKDCIVN